MKRLVIRTSNGLTIMSDSLEVTTDMGVSAYAPGAKEDTDQMILGPLLEQGYTFTVSYEEAVSEEKKP